METELINKNQDIDLKLLEKQKEASRYQEEVDKIEAQIATQRQIIDQSAQNNAMYGTQCEQMETDNAALDDEIKGLEQ